MTRSHIRSALAAVAVSVFCCDYFGAAGFMGGNERKPLINITASLVSSTGNVVWKKTDYITNLSKLTQAYTYDQLAQNPQLTTKSFEQASVFVSRQILAGLKQ